MKLHAICSTLRKPFPKETVINPVSLRDLTAVLRDIKDAITGSIPMSHRIPCFRFHFFATSSQVMETLLVRGSVQKCFRRPFRVDLFLVLWTLRFQNNDKTRSQPRSLLLVLLSCCSDLFSNRTLRAHTHRRPPIRLCLGFHKSRIRRKSMT